MTSDAPPAPPCEASAQPVEIGPQLPRPAATFHERLIACMDKGNLRLADLSHWFGKPYHTVWFWVYKHRMPRSLKGQRKLMMDRLANLEKVIPFKFPDGLNQFERPKYIEKTRIEIESSDSSEGRYGQFGWHDGSFLYGHQRYTATSITPALGTRALDARSNWLAPARGGSIKEWSRAANTLFAKGCEAQSFALLCSFAAPLLQFYPAGSRGVILSLVNARRGNGSYTALQSIESVWGSSDVLFVTQADVESGNILGNLPIIYDELSARDPEIVNEFVTRFYREDSFPTALVTTANYSVANMLRNMSSGRRVVDVFEIVVKVPKGPKHSHTLQRDLRSNSGWAGDVFLRRLVQPETIAYVKAGIPQWQNEVQSSTKSDNAPGVRLIAGVIAASTIVKDLGILDFSISRIAQWAMKYLKHGHHSSLEV